MNHKNTCFCICAKIHILPLYFLFYYIWSHTSIDHLDVFNAAIIISWDKITYIKSLLSLHVYCGYLTHRFTWWGKTKEFHQAKTLFFPFFFFFFPLAPAGTVSLLSHHMAKWRQSTLSYYPFPLQTRDGAIISTVVWLHLAKSDGEILCPQFLDRTCMDMDMNMDRTRFPSVRNVFLILRASDKHLKALAEHYQTVHKLEKKQELGT